MYKKLPVVDRDDVHIGCLNCSTTQWPKVSMLRKIWGEGTIIKNNKTVYDARMENDVSWENAPTLMKFENMARKDPDADWRYEHISALHEEEYQRQGKNNWVMIRSGMGYA